MDKTELPPLPAINQSGPEVCSVVQLYLAIIDDLTEEERALLHTHIAFCAACAEDYRIQDRATRLVESTPTTTPSPRVDAAIRAMIEGYGQRQPDIRPVPALAARRRTSSRRRIGNLAGGLVIAAALVLALFSALHFSSILEGTQTAFALPPNLSWSQDVLYHSETRTSADGQLYSVESYDELSTGNMHVETKMGNQLDVVAVSDTHETVGMDMIHHVAQMGADQWMVDDSMFDLQQLRHAFQTKDATYIGTDTFRGQKVYRIRYRDGLVMLLDMQYRPINVLRGAVGPGTGEPVYTVLQLLPPSHVPSSMWDMNIPSGYQMGTLPGKP